MAVEKRAPAAHHRKISENLFRNGAGDMGYAYTIFIPFEKKTYLAYFMAFHLNAF